MAKMIRAVIFDCFGVLFPNASNLFYERHKQRFQHGTAFLDCLNAQIDLDEITSAEFFEAVGQAIGMSAEQVHREFKHDLVLNKPLADFIRQLRTTYKIGLLSNAGSGEIAIIDEAGISDLFDARAVSCEVGTIKPRPEIFQICAKRLEVHPRECVFIDDSKVNLPPAGALGMQTILYTDFERFKLQFNELIALV
jgi:epoxide hydrolase-like predicted phosphatase